jgi:hypothetical protein
VEEVLLAAAEVVVERATRDAGRAHDLLGAHARVPALGEERPSRRDQRAARRR